MVMDEYGGIAGLITIEDVLEQIVGDIDDEYDVDQGEQITARGEHRYSVAALLPIDQFNEYFGSSFSDEHFDTVGGLVVHGMGHVPRAGECIVIGDYNFRVLRADRRRVQLLEVSPDRDEPGRADAP